MTFKLTAHDFALANEHGEFSTEPGHWELQVGGDEGASMKVLVTPADSQQVVI